MNQTKCIVSQQVEAYARRERIKASKVCLTKDAFQLSCSAVFQYMEYQETMVVREICYFSFL
jgi:hypothetical protein